MSPEKAWLYIIFTEYFHGIKIIFTDQTEIFLYLRHQKSRHGVKMPGFFIKNGIGADLGLGTGKTLIQFHRFFFFIDLIKADIT